MATPFDPEMDPEQTSPEMDELPPELAGGGEPEDMPEDHIDLTDLYEAIHAGAVLCRGATTGGEFQQAAAGIKALVDSVHELIGTPDDNDTTSAEGDGGGNAPSSGE